MAADALAQRSANDLASVTPTHLRFISARISLAGELPPTASTGAPADASKVEFYGKSLQELIMLAYHVKIYQISGPDWLGDKRFDVEATLPEGTTADEVPAMLRTMLEDRFKLVARREMKNRAVLVLKVAKGGPKLRTAIATVGVSGATGGPGLTRETPVGAMRISDNGHDGSTLTFTSISMDGLAEVLTYLLHGGYDNGLALKNVTEDEDVWQVVVNDTGLKGTYQVSINSSLVGSIAETRIMDDTFGSSETSTRDVLGPAQAIDEGDPMTFASLARQGLEVKRESARMEVLVVSHAEKRPE